MAEQQNRTQNRQNKQSSSSNRSSSKKSSSGPGRGWHGDPEGHARAGSQSHKNK